MNFYKLFSLALIAGFFTVSAAAENTADRKTAATAAEMVLKGDNKGLKDIYSISLSTDDKQLASITAKAVILSLIYQKKDYNNYILLMNKKFTENHFFNFLNRFEDAPCERCKGRKAYTSKCSTCKGSSKCMNCKGKGVEQVKEDFIGTVGKECSSCKGATKCSPCKGLGFSQVACKTCDATGRKDYSKTAQALQLKSLSDIIKLSNPDTKGDAFGLSPKERAILIDLFSDDS